MFSLNEKKKLKKKKKRENKKTKVFSNDKDKIYILLCNERGRLLMVHYEDFWELRT